MQTKIFLKIPEKSWKIMKIREYLRDNGFSRFSSKLATVTQCLDQTTIEHIPYIDHVQLSLCFAGMVCCCNAMLLFAIDMLRQHHYVLVVQQILPQCVQRLDDRFNSRYVHQSAGRLHDIRHLRPFGTFNRDEGHWFGGQRRNWFSVRFLSWYELCDLMNLLNSELNRSPVYSKNTDAIAKFDWLPQVTFSLMAAKILLNKK